ncbi:MAG: TrmH family RNA methyltransferase [Acidimicrobiia bacterium]|nr:TrmH family RNA methyltransferase [Acidimicrobiia bacterium]
MLATALTTVTPQPVAAIVRRPDTDPASAVDRAGAGTAPADRRRRRPRQRRHTAADRVGGRCGGPRGGPRRPTRTRPRWSAPRPARRCGCRSPSRRSGPQTVDLLRKRGMRCVAAVARGGVAPETVDLSGPVVLAVGPEAGGLGPATVALADELVTIPMADSVESLNAGVAGSALLLESARQRRAEGESDDLLHLVSRVSHAAPLAPHGGEGIHRRAPGALGSVWTTNAGVPWSPTWRGRATTWRVWSPSCWR